MPTPKPSDGEAHDAFLSRCHRALADEFEDQSQRNAVCEQAWRDRGKARAGMDGLEHKAIASGVTVKDPDQGIVEAVVARVNVVDADGDIFLPGSFGTQKVRVSAYNHRSWPQRGGEMPVGKGTISENGEEVRAELQFFMKTVAGREHFEHVREMGDLQEWSYGWPPGAETRGELSDEQQRAGVRRAIKSVPVVEVSPVMLASSVGTHTVAVKDDAPDPEPDAEPEPDGGAELKTEIAREVVRYEVQKRLRRDICDT